MAVLFVSEDTIKKSTTINGNVDVELLLPYIKVAQDIHIHQLLGTDLYDKIQADITGDTLTGNYKTFTDDYIQPVLIHYALYECLPFLSYKIWSKTIKVPVLPTPAEQWTRGLKVSGFFILNSLNFCNNSIKCFESGTP